jgi:UDP-GlcNAc:undecaprenyl-phosphate/decaprenyl-phosphate GlcNAc-1-phosphate transferase
MTAFPINLYMLALAVSFATAFFSLPLWTWWANRTGLVDDPGHRKIHTAPIPLAGGLAVCTGMMLPIITAVVSLKLHLVTLPAGALLGYGIARRSLQLIAILGGAFAIVLLGWMDDRWELKPAIKFAGQFVVAFAVAGAGIRITLFVPSAVFSYLITILWILTVINAYNFMDNMNGLCAGLGVIAAFCFAAAAATQGQYLVTIMALLMCGALAGFLPHNYPNAKAFLGDAGSHLVGFMMAVLAVLPHFYSKNKADPWLVLCPLLILAVPLLDLVWVVAFRCRLGKPFYIGDTNHWSHRLVRKGWSKPGAVLVIWLTATLTGFLAVMLQSK